MYVWLKNKPSLSAVKIREQWNSWKKTMRCLHTIPASTRITVHISVCSTWTLCHTVSISRVVKLPLRTWFYYQETQIQKNRSSAEAESGTMIFGKHWYYYAVSSTMSVSLSVCLSDEKGWQDCFTKMMAYQQRRQYTQHFGLSLLQMCRNITFVLFYRLCVSECILKTFFIAMYVLSTDRVRFKRFHNAEHEPNRLWWLCKYSVLMMKVVRCLKTFFDGNKTCISIISVPL